LNFSKNQPIAACYLAKILTLRLRCYRDYDGHDRQA